MRLHATTAVVWLLLASVTAVALGEGSPPKLPKERGWTRYHAITQSAGGTEVIGTYIFKALDKTTVDGKPCQWFEAEYTSKENEIDRHERRKLLISDETFATSARPMEETLRLLERVDAGPLTSISPDEAAWLISDFMSFPGFSKDAKRVDDLRTVTHQHGKLEIRQALVGTYRWSRKDKPPPEATVFETDYRIWMHPDLPVGVAHATTTLKIVKAGKTLRTWRLDYALQEFGDDAKPAIVEDAAPPAK